MPIPVALAEGPPGHAAIDLNEALDAARTARDRAGHADLKNLLFGFLQEQLGELSRARLDRKLGSFQVWRSEGVHVVFKTVGEPCVAYTALEFDDGIVRIVALGFCYRVPGSEETWWQTVIRPRLRHLI